MKPEDGQFSPHAIDRINDVCARLTENNHDRRCPALGQHHHQAPYPLSLHGKAIFCISVDTVNFALMRFAAIRFDGHKAHRAGKLLTASVFWNLCGLDKMLRSVRNGEKRQMIPRVIIRLSLLAILWLASAAVAQERDSADRSNMAPDATAKPGPDQHVGDQETHKETKMEPAEPTIATSSSICLLINLQRRRMGSHSSFSGD